MSRRFTYRYAFAIVAFASLAVVWKVTADASQQRIRELTDLTEEAAEQPARVYRILDLAQNVTFQSPESDRRQIDQWASDLEAESKTLTQTMDGLVNGDMGLNLPKVNLTADLDQLYNEPDRLQQNIDDVARAAVLISNLKTYNDANNSTRQEQYALIVARQTDVIKGLEKAVTLYTEQTDRELRAMDNNNFLFIILSGLMSVAVVFVLFRPMARSIHSETSALEQAERNHRENNERQTFRNELSQALEVTDNEDEVLAAVGRAIVSVVEDNKVELLLSDSSHAHLRRAQVSPTAGAAGCPVESPWGCAAIRRGQTVVYESSRMLNVCPKLPEHEPGVCSAVCVPVMFMGRSLGVLHTVGPDGHPPTHTEIERLSVLASETGSRLGTLRATQATELQASTDGLTGLFNRRTLESKARGFMLDSKPFSIAMADLDHFKSLNDTHGHEAGDRALRQFASVLRNNLRPDDIPARYGGEEFVILLPGTNIREALPALERLQVSLAEEVAKAGGIAFTASWGLTDNTAGATFDEIVAVADAALYSAKRAGRDCIMVDGEAAAAAGLDAGDDEVASPPEGGDGSAPMGDGPLIEIDMELLEAEMSKSQGKPGEPPS